MLSFRILELLVEVVMGYRSEWLALIPILVAQTFAFGCGGGGNDNRAVAVAPVCVADSNCEVACAAGADPDCIAPQDSVLTGVVEIEESELPPARMAWAAVIGLE